MLKRYLLVGFWILAAAAVIPLAVSCGSDKETAIQYGDDVSGLIDYYKEMRETGLAGKVEKFQSMRDSVTKGEVAAYFERMGWVIDSARVSSWSFNWPEINDIPLAQDSILGDWRRLIFRQCGLINRSAEDNCVYSIIMFHLDSDGWRVGNATRIGGLRYNKDGSEVTLDQLSFHRMFDLPPSFADLQPKPPPPIREGMPNVPPDSAPKWQPGDRR